MAHTRAGKRVERGRVAGATAFVVACLLGGCGEEPAVHPGASGGGAQEQAVREPVGGLGGAAGAERTTPRPAGAAERVAPAGLAAGAPDRAPGGDATPAPLERRPVHDGLATAFDAPALGLEAAPGTQVEVDPLSGVATVYEADASLPLGLGLRRARWGDADAPGLFGRGWRSELDATLHRAAGDGRVLRRLDGVVVYGRLQVGVWRSLSGEVEHLVREEGGTYAVVDPAGRVLRFDADGRLAEVLPGYVVERAPGQVRLVGDAGTIALDLDLAGRAVRATGSGVALAWDYDGDGRLVAVRGARARRYAHDDAGRLAAVDDARGALVRLAWDADGRVERVLAPRRAGASQGEGGAGGEDAGWTQAYAFERGWAHVATPGGDWTYALTDDGWRVETPWGTDTITTDDRLRVLFVRPAGAEPYEVVRDRLGRVLGPRPLVPWPPGHLEEPQLQEKPVKLQDHGAGHGFGDADGVGDQGPHFNVRPNTGDLEADRNAHVPGTREHYPFETRRGNRG